MAKKIKTVLKLNLSAGVATPAPPVGPILGQAGINMMDFLKQYNAQTADQKGQIIPAEITVFENNSFSFFYHFYNLQNYYQYLKFCKNLVENLYILHNYLLYN